MGRQWPAMAGNRPGIGRESVGNRPGIGTPARMRARGAESVPVFLPIKEAQKKSLFLLLRGLHCKEWGALSAHAVGERRN